MYRVNTISSFMEILEKIGIDNYVFRGQNEPYFSIEANGFRTYLGGWESDKIYDLDYIQKQFRRRVIKKLTDDEKKHFLAYCQHYGIPTNLVDFSYSPLVALFFACEGKEEIRFSPKDLVSFESWEELKSNKSKQEMLIHNMINEAEKPYHSKFAQVYLLRKERLIDISDLVLLLDGKNLFDELLKREKILEVFCKIVNKHFSLIKDEELKMGWLINIAEEFIRVFSDYQNDFLLDVYNLEEIKNIIENIKVGEKSEKSFWIRKLIQSIKASDGSDEDMLIGFIKEQTEEFPNDGITIPYIILLLKIIEIMKSMPSKIGLHFDIYFTYQPPELFDRISNQQGFFIYQPYLYENDGVYNYHELIVQKITPDITIEISDYKKVLHNLALLGISNGNVYGDIDNIAKTVLRTSTKWYDK